MHRTLAPLSIAILAATAFRCGTPSEADPPTADKRVGPTVRGAEGAPESKPTPRERSDTAARAGSSDTGSAERTPPEQMTTWRRLSPGVAYRVFPGFGESEVGPRELHAVRITPRLASPVLRMISRDGGEARTAAVWCRDEGLLVAVNAGMYLTDFRTHVGYLRDGRHVNARKWNRKYRSALVWGRTLGDRPPLDILDIPTPEDRSRAEGYRTAVQNLALIKGTGTPSWRPQRKRWSETAVAVDRKGRLLFLFSRSPYSMRQFADLVLSLPLGIVRAQHVEGGPEASLSIHGGGVDRDLSGSYETGFNENDGNRRQWPLPNVIGVLSQTPP